MAGDWDEEKAWTVAYECHACLLIHESMDPFKRCLLSVYVGRVGSCCRLRAFSGGRRRDEAPQTRRRRLKGLESRGSAR
jgi:hypothetical protein